VRDPDVPFATLDEPNDCPMEACLVRQALLGQATRCAEPTQVRAEGGQMRLSRISPPIFHRRDAKERIRSDRLLIRSILPPSTFCLNGDLMIRAVRRWLSPHSF
jgi:hypothetical protein